MGFDGVFGHRLLVDQAYAFHMFESLDGLNFPDR